MYCLILFKSITYAQNASIRLKAAGINSYITKTPVSLSGGGCGYSLKIKCRDVDRAKNIVAKNNIGYISLFRINEKGGFTAL